MYRVIRGGFQTKHPSTYVMSRPDGLNCYVVLNIKTFGEFNINGIHYHVVPGTSLIISPGTPYSYSNPKGFYIDDWLHFTVDAEDSFDVTFPCLNVPMLLDSTENYSTLFRQILWEVSYTEAVFSESNVHCLFTVLVNHLMSLYANKGTSLESHPYTTQLRDLRLDIQNRLDDAPTITECAASLGVSESYFQHLYSDVFGVSFQRDVIHFRIEHTKNLLLTTDLSMEQIAEICGYSNTVHFFRQFKKIAGMTPAKFRKNIEIHW